MITLLGGHSCKDINLAGKMVGGENDKGGRKVSGDLIIWVNVLKHDRLIPDKRSLRAVLENDYDEEPEAYTSTGV